MGYLDLLGVNYSTSATELSRNVSWRYQMQAQNSLGVCMITSISVETILYIYYGHVQSVSVLPMLIVGLCVSRGRSLLVGTQN